MTNTTNPELNPADGFLVYGVKLDKHRFVGGMKAAQLLKIADDPRRSEDVKQRSGNTQLENLYRLRAEVQRLFEGAKKKNVEKYARYVVDVQAGTDGMAPPIILYCENLLRDSSDGPTGYVQIPWDCTLIAIDGETQLAARFEAASINDNTKEDFVPVLLCHGKSLHWARQVFHDLNLLAVKPNAAVGIGMDQRDPLTFIAREVEKAVPFLTNRVNVTRRQLRKSDSEIVTITSLRGACITLAVGISGVKYGAKPVPIPNEQISNVKTAAIEWFDAITQLLGSAMEDRERTVAPAPAVLAAIGAMGHTLMAMSDAAQRRAERNRLLEHLRGVNWDKGKHWEGIAGKFTPKGEFSIGGPKETAHSIYASLADPSSSGYRRIRQAVEEVA